MINRILTIAITILILAALSGCATIFKGKSADVRVNSTPAGAEVYINEISRGTTPQTLSLKRNDDYLLEFRKDGYEPVRIEVKKDFDIGTTIVGNIFSWGIIGILVDVGTGAAYTLKPADLQANMPELRAAGYLPEGGNSTKDDVHVIMLTTDEWAELTNN